MVVDPGGEPPGAVPADDVVEVVVGAVVDVPGRVDAGAVVVERAGGGTTTTVVEVVGTGLGAVVLGAAGAVG